jgi:hypothetical protein
MKTSKIFTLLMVAANVSAAPLLPSVTVSMDHFEVLRMGASTTASKIPIVIFLPGRERIWAPRPGSALELMGYQC